jgi:hypothetical protein
MVRAQVEALDGQSVLSSLVRHLWSRASQLAATAGERAFARGPDLHAGEANPLSGRLDIAHESDLKCFSCAAAQPARAATHKR